jgi:hypothetical protein
MYLRILALFCVNIAAVLVCLVFDSGLLKDFPVTRSLLGGLSFFWYLVVSAVVGGDLVHDHL